MLDLLKIRRKAKRRADANADPAAPPPGPSSPPPAPPQPPVLAAPEPPPAPAPPPAEPPPPRTRVSEPVFDPARDYEPPAPPPRRRAPVEPPEPADDEAALAAAAAALLPPSADAEAPAPETAELDAARELGMRHLICTVAAQQFAVPISDILEILRERPLTPVPLTPDALAGVLSLRGRMVPVIEAAARLGLPAAVSDENTRIVVFDQNGEWVGLRVAGVGTVTPIDPDHLQHTAAALGETSAEMITGVARIGDKFVTVPVLGRLLEIRA